MKNEVQNYMSLHKWVLFSDRGAGIYTNGKLFVLCNGMQWFASRTPDASERWARGWANMLPAMMFADRMSEKIK